MKKVRRGTMTPAEVKAKRIGVLMGGLSSERKVSLDTGAAILGALQAKGYNAVGLDVGMDVAARLLQEKIEIAFIALHGRYGEDGVIQGLLELLRIPYTGSGVLASALGMDKYFARRLFTAAGIKSPRCVLVPEDDAKAKEEFLPLPLPMVVKPVREGSSVGVAIVDKKADIAPALAAVFKYDPRALVEEYLPGREIQVGILDDEVLGTIEIIPKRKFYDYIDKYSEDGAKHIQPAPLSPAQEQEVFFLALQAHQALDCEGATRVDFILCPERGFYILEINTLPGMTAMSLLPEIARGRGMEFPELVERILLSARLKA